VRDWRRAFPATAVACRLRAANADFQVRERLGIELSGDGEHDYLQIEKDGANTAWVARGLAKFAGIAAKDVAFAGLKDRHAVTRQWFSVRRPAGDKPDWAKLQLDGVRLLQQGRHRRKLRRGAHAGNYFRIALRNVTESGELRERLSLIRACGVPNYFGEQRFGHDGGNLRRALDLFAGRRLERGERGMALSAARSFLFNEILEDRLRQGTWDMLQAGDCASLDGSASFFPVEVVDDELRRRCNALDIHPSGALWGDGPPQSAGDIAARELALVARFPDLADGLARARLEQARRALRLAVRELAWEEHGDTLWLNFYLVRGAFATAVLREIVGDDN
jgi:tRNA pseudouridine13 synthase